MSKSASTPHPNPFFERVILFLMSHFLPVCSDEAVARKEILATLASYGGNSRSEVINAARIIAFSFATLDTLAEAKDSDLSPAMRLRYKGCANNLNRSCQQNERMMVERLAGPEIAIAEPAAEPVNDLPDTLAEGALEQARAQIDSYRDRLPGARSPKPPARTLPGTEQEEEHKRMWGNAMIDVLNEMGIPIQLGAA